MGKNLIPIPGDLTFVLKELITNGNQFEIEEDNLELLNNYRQVKFFSRFR